MIKIEELNSPYRGGKQYIVNFNEKYSFVCGNEKAKNDAVNILEKHGMDGLAFISNRASVKEHIE